jgi:hypothetical protein
MLTGLIRGRLYRAQQWTFGFHERWGISRLAEQLLASLEEDPSREVRLCRAQQWTFGFYERWGISRLAEQLLASLEEDPSREVITYD